MEREGFRRGDKPSPTPLSRGSNEWAKVGEKIECADKEEWGSRYASLGHEEQGYMDETYKEAKAKLTAGSTGGEANAGPLAKAPAGSTRKHSFRSRHGTFESKGTASVTKAPRGSAGGEAKAKAPAGSTRGHSRQGTFKSKAPASKPNSRVFTVRCLTISRAILSADGHLGESKAKSKKYTEFHVPEVDMRTVS